MSRAHAHSRPRFRVINGRRIWMPKNCHKTGKVNFADRIQAQLALVDALRRPTRGGTQPVRYYQCNLCPWYHLTSQDLHERPIAHSA